MPIAITYKADNTRYCTAACLGQILKSLQFCLDQRSMEEAIAIDLAFDSELAELSLAIMARLIQNASCVQSLSVEAPIAQALWLIHRPTSFNCLAIALKILQAVSGTYRKRK